MMNPFSFHPGLLYALVDGALVDGFYGELAQIDKLRYKSLLTGTIDANSAAVGPVLLNLQPDIHKDLIQKLLILQTQYPTPVWLNTDMTFTSLFYTLRQLLYIEKEDGSQFFFRYYDKNHLPTFLSLIYQNPDYACMMKKIIWATWINKEHYQYYSKD